MPWFGTDKETPWATFNSAVGPVYGYRGYNTPAAGVPASWPGSNAGPIPAGVPAEATIISLNQSLPDTLAGTYDAALAAYFATVPPGAFVSCWAEGETAGTAANMIAAHIRVYGIFKANAPATARYGQIFTNASSMSGNAGYPLSSCACTAANSGTDLDFYGIDVYPRTATDTPAAAVEDCLAHLAAAGMREGTPVAVPEVGTFSWYTGDMIQSWYAGVWAQAVNHGFTHVLTWWYSACADAILHWPPAAAVVTELTAEAAAARKPTPATCCIRHADDQQVNTTPVPLEGEACHSRSNARRDCPGA